MIRALLTGLAIFALTSAAEAKPAHHCAPPSGLWSMLTSPPACGFAKAHRHHMVRSSRHRTAVARVPIPRESPQRPAWMRAAEETFLTLAAGDKQCFDAVFERSEITERPALMEFRDFVLQHSDDAFAATGRR
jgi:hypothetical protein